MTNGTRNHALMMVRKFAVWTFVLALLGSSCGKKSQHLPAFDNGWSPPALFLASDRITLSMWNGVPVAIDGSDFYKLNETGTNWTKFSFPLPQSIPESRPRSDPFGSTLIFYDGKVSSGNIRTGRLEMRIASLSLDLSSGLKTIFDRRVIVDTDELLGTNRTPTCEISFPPAWKQYGPPATGPQRGRLGGGRVVGEDVLVAYSVECGSVYGTNLTVNSTGPNQAGYIRVNAADSRWTKTKLLDIDTSWHDIFATRDYLHFLAATGGGLEKNIPRGLWHVRVSRTSNTQFSPELVTPSFAGNASKYSAVSEGDTIHLAWLDNRNERSHDLRAMLTRTSSLENNWELFYRSRKDTADAWTKEVRLSGVLDFAFDPSMAIEGDRIVVAWSGYMRDKSRAYPRLHQSDIYFTTSNDNGKTWRSPTRVTNHAETGLASILPQVILHKGVIHLFYVAGALNYQRRTFPAN